MPIPVICPECKFKGNVPDKAVGMKVSCRNCKKLFLVEAPPAPAAPVPPPPLVPILQAAKEMPRAEPVPPPADVELVPLAPPAPPPAPALFADADEVTVCPHCDQENKVAAQLIGTEVACGHCKQAFKAVLKATADEAELYSSTEAFVNALRLAAAIIAGVAFLIGLWAGYDYGLPGFLWVVIPTAICAVILELVFRSVLLLVDIARNVNRMTLQKPEPVQRDQFDQQKGPPAG